jgi:hypothetical protein
MARPLKQGLDYFPLDVGFFEDIKIRRIKKDFGSESITVLMGILCDIYRNEGYYVELNDDLLFLMSEQFNLEEAFISSVIERAVEVDFFDKGLYEREKILTSRGIQKRFFEAVSRRKEVIYEPDYMLIRVNDYNNLVNANINPVNDDRSTQSKVKESKEEKRKEDIRACAREDSSSSSSDTVIYFLQIYNQAFGESLEVTDLTAEEVKALACLTPPKIDKIISNVVNTPYLRERNTIPFIAKYALGIYKDKYKQYKDPPKARSGTHDWDEESTDQQLWERYGIKR